MTELFILLRGVCVCVELALNAMVYSSDMEPKYVDYKVVVHLNS